MMQQHNHPRVIIHPQPVYRRQPIHCGPECCTKCALIFFTIIFMLVGFILTMVGNFAKPFWGPEDDWCDFCREDRLQTERDLKNCRIAGPIFLGMGGLLLIFSICYCQTKKKDNAGQVLSGPTTGQTGSTTQAGTGTVIASGHYGFGEMPGYGTATYPKNPPQPAGYPSYPTGPAYPPPAQFPYTSPQSGKGYQPCSADLPPPPSYESSVGQSSTTPSAPPLEKGSF